MPNTLNTDQIGAVEHDDHKQQPLPLLGAPLSDQAHRLVDSLLNDLVLPQVTRLRSGRVPASGSKTVERYRKACGALLADLIDLQADASSEVVAQGYHGLSKSDFSHSRLGFGQDIFIVIRSALEAGGIISVELGDKTPNQQRGSSRRKQTRFALTPNGLRLAVEVGLIGDDYSLHWHRYCGQELPEGQQLIQLKEAATYYNNEKRPGKQMDFELTDHPKAAKAATELQVINDYLRGQSFGRLAFPGLKRIYNSGNKDGFDWNKGGRFYSLSGGHRYESWSALKRQRELSINGEETAEVDLKASHLTLLYALMEQPLDPSVDPYEIDGIPRALVKAWVTKSLGVSHAFHRGWPKEVVADYERERPDGDLEDDFPHQLVRGSAQSKHPVLLKVDPSIHGPLDLQYHEAEIMRLTMEDLMLTQDVAVLPIHDAIICGRSKQGAVKEALVRNFQAYVEGLTGRACLVTPTVAIKGA